MQAMFYDHDTFSKKGAEALKKRIEEYWAARGYDVQVEIYEQPFNERVRSRRWDVRTDMVGGLPVRKLTRAA